MKIAELTTEIRTYVMETLVPELCTIDVYEIMISVFDGRVGEFALNFVEGAEEIPKYPGRAIHKLKQDMFPEVKNAWVIIIVIFFFSFLLFVQKFFVLLFVFFFFSFDSSTKYVRNKEKKEAAGEENKKLLLTWARILSKCL